MKEKFIVILLFIGYANYAQDFQEEIEGKSLVIVNLNNVNNLQFEINTQKSRTSVWIEMLMKDGKKETKKICKDSLFTISAKEIEKVTVVHKRRFIFRVKNKIDFDPPRQKSKSKRSLLNRTRVTSTGGSATSTAVVAT